jgi:predicted nucleic acid-binding protein
VASLSQVLPVGCETLLPGRLRSADAIHLATALGLNARAMAVYDRELISSARIAGIDPISPGAG